MNAGNDSAGAGSNTDKILDSIAAGKRAPIIGFVVLLVLYVIATILLQSTSRSEDAIMLMGSMIPVRSLTGVFSALSNLSIIFLVVFYKKPGFIVSMVILVSQYPYIIFSFVVQHNPASIAGFFANLLAILAIVLIYTNDVKLRKSQEKIREQAITDQLTGLPNRFACSELMDTLMKDRESFAVAVLSVNNMKNIANTMGQHTVDALLAEVGARWKKVADGGLTRTSDFVTCQGGEDFTIVIRDFADDGDIAETLSRYLAEMDESITVDGSDYFLTANIGFAEYPVDAEDGEGLIACANSALAATRSLNSDYNIRRFTKDLNDSEQIIETERKIRTAIDNGMLYFDLQPQYDISHNLSGFEALARIREADGSILSPGTFIPVAEEVGLIDEIDYAVFRDSAKFFGELIRKTNTNVKLSVNISVRHLMKNDFLDEVRNIIDTCGVPANQLEIEITESIMIDSVERALQCINEVKGMGVRIAIDDFGTGYSSLSYLNNFPADLLKIDKSFIDVMNTSEASKQYVAAIVAIGHVMNFDVISEGVEDPEQLETLRGVGCDYIQGFIWGRPISPELAEKLVMETVR